MMNLANKSLLITLISLCTLNVYSTRLCLFVTELLVVRCDKIYIHISQRVWYNASSILLFLLYYVDLVHCYQMK